jgi:nitrogen regulatory protein P-II 1
MKKIEAIIRPYKLDALREALERAGIGGLTSAEARGVGRQRGATKVYRGMELVVDFFPKTKVEIIVPDARAAECVDIILRETRTGKQGDGKIFILPLDRVLRIRTGEEDENAV